MDPIDLRSDTITLPSPEMRAAMADAELGDDVFGEDPTINRFQELAAGRLGKEAALFTSSGTQSNLVSLLTHCGRGAEVILGEEAHILFFEQGGAWALGGIGLRPVRNDANGRLDLADARAKIHPENDHFPRTGLIAVENTHNRCGGTILDEEGLASVRQLADEHGLPVHMDGARIFNAASALHVSTAGLAAYADSVCFSLSKGLGCPVGSVICGSHDFIREARRNRKLLGGGMRQAGVLAAAGIYALDNMVERLAEDHENARFVADGLRELPGVNLDPEPQTNLIYFSIEGWDTGVFVERLAAKGVLCFDEGRRRIRWVTHFGIERSHIEEALARARDVIVAGP